LHYGIECGRSERLLNMGIGSFKLLCSPYDDLDSRSSISSSNQVIMRKTMLTSLIFLNWLFIHSCSMINSGDPLAGKIVVTDTQKHECFIYEGSDTPELSFKLKNDSEAEYSGVDWLNTKDAFVGTEGISGLTPM